MSEQEANEANEQMATGGDNPEEPLSCVVMLSSYLTSNSTITLSEFRKYGIHDGYKYVPKAKDVVPPYCVVHYLAEKNMNLAVINDVKLFLEDNPEIEFESTNLDADAASDAEPDP
ncbi:GL20922 [Drosophila persimilis]|uniref:GL20922 n=1 Tax=Drosophila persimilis TaxID=7234 RepID=B4H950_DROPE|nr:uncharacterized protein LOC6602339 [Drosophila persimilis]EDW35274.1 GL20922 [Drosophila persimilis]